MKLIARQMINGITNDDGLYALDGIKSFEAEVESVDELIALFESKYPNFAGCNIEIVK